MALPPITPEQMAELYAQFVDPLLGVRLPDFELVPRTTIPLKLGAVEKKVAPELVEARMVRVLAPTPELAAEIAEMDRVRNDPQDLEDGLQAVAYDRVEAEIQQQLLHDVEMRFSKVFGLWTVTVPLQPGCTLPAGLPSHNPADR